MQRFKTSSSSRACKTLWCIAFSIVLLTVVVRLSGVTPVETIRCGSDSAVHCLGLSYDGSRVAYSLSLDKTVRIYDRRLGRVEAAFEMPSGRITSLTFDTTGKRLTAAIAIRGQESENAWVWDVGGGQPRVIGGVSTVRAAERVAEHRVEWNSDDRAVFDHRLRLLFNSNYRPTSLFITDSRKEGDASPIYIYGHLDGINDWVFTPDGEVLITAGGYVDHPWPVNRSGDVRLWDVRTGRRLATLSTRLIWSSHWGGIAVIAISGDGKILATGGVDGLVKLWDLEGLLKRIGMWKAEKAG